MPDLIFRKWQWQRPGSWSTVRKDWRQTPIPLPRTADNGLQQWQQKQLGTQSLLLFALRWGLNLESCASAELYPECCLLLCTPFINALFMSFFPYFWYGYIFFFHERSAQNKITKARGKLAFLACFSLEGKCTTKYKNSYLDRRLPKCCVTMGSTTSQSSEFPMCKKGESD